MKLEHDEQMINAVSHKNLLYMESAAYEEKLSEIKEAKEYHEMLLNGVSDCLTGLTYLAGLIFLMQMYLDWRYLMMDAAIIILFVAASYRADNRVSELMYSFWKKYRENTRLYNAYSDILMKREYILEKKAFGYTNFFVGKFEQEFAHAADLNRTAGKKRLDLELRRDGLYLVFLFAQMLFLTCMSVYCGMPLSFFIVILPFSIRCFAKLSDLFMAVNDLRQVEIFQKNTAQFVNKEQPPVQNNFVFA